MAEGDVGRAKEHLLAAGGDSGSRVLGSFGPNMMLAEELIERGEREAVLEYLELCSRFWDLDRIGAWADLVRAGRTPDFEREPALLSRCIGPGKGRRLWYSALDADAYRERRNDPSPEGRVFTPSDLFVVILRLGTHWCKP